MRTNIASFEQSISSGVTICKNFFEENVHTYVGVCNILNSRFVFFEHSGRGKATV